ncbi:MAG TPA: glycosyltransferase family 39 protein [bacterium]
MDHSPKRAERKVRALAALVLLVHVALANSAAWDKCSAFDEYAHIASGVSIWATGDYRMAACGIGQYRWMTLPIVLGDYRLPAAAGEVWERAANWKYGRALMFELGNDPQRILHATRLMTSLLSAVLGALVFAWARELFGAAGGLVALAVYAFNPTVLAHGSAATLDLAAALAFTAAIWTHWRLLHRLSPLRLAGTGLIWGWALTVKFSTLLLLPMALALVAVRVAAARPWEVRWGARRMDITTRGAMIASAALVAAAHAAVSWLLVWAMFGFRFEMHRRLAGGVPDPAVIQFSDWLPRAGSYAPLVELFHQWRLLPEGLLFGLLDTMGTVEKFNTFLNGRFGYFGFASFFPYALLYKTPVPAFLLSGAAIAAFAVGLRRRAGAQDDATPEPERPMNTWYKAMPLWVIFLGYGYAAIVSRIDIGIRHILPIFPALCILTGAAGHWLRSPARRSRWRSVPALLVALSLLWLVAETAAAYPNYLAYFNVVGGGSRRGYRHLVDSSFDWGQELPALKTRLDALDAGPGPPPTVYFSYFGSSPPSAYGIRARMLPCFFDVGFLEPGLRQQFEPELTPGLYVISASMMESVYNVVAPGPWRTDYEEHYQRLQREVKAFFASDEAGRRRLVDERGVENWVKAVADFEGLRFARVCAYLRQREPGEEINHSLLVYSLTQEDLKAALHGPPAEAYPPPATPDGNVPY